MNIDLNAAATKQRSKNKVRSLDEANKNIHFGLNKRGDFDNNRKCKEKKKKAAFSFGDDGDSSSSVDVDEEGKIVELSGRKKVNRAIAAEQEAKRRSTQTLLMSAKNDASIYDYDGAFDSFSSAKQKTKPSNTNGEKKKESRYISNLLKTANRRKYEHEMVYERKVAKEQEAEEPEHVGKEKFVTKAYKRKLAERESWAKSDELLEKEQKENEIKRSKDGNKSFMAGFYGNFNRNLAATNDAATNDNDINSVQEKQQNDSELSQENSDENLAFLQGFEKPNDASPTMEKTQHSEKISTNQGQNGSESNETETSKEFAIHSKSFILQKSRIQKILKARMRYLERMQVSM